MFFAIIVALVFIISGIGYLILPAGEYWQNSRDPRRQNERLGNQLEAILRLTAGAICVLIGCYWLERGLGFGRFAALVFGAACLVGAWWVLRRYRRNWRQLASAHGARRNEVVVHLIAIPGLAVLGVIVLAYGLF